MFCLGECREKKNIDAFGELLNGEWMGSTAVEIRLDWLVDLSYSY